MVMRWIIIVGCFFALAEPAFALLSQTTDDLQRLEDDLALALQDNKLIADKMLPLPCNHNFMFKKYAVCKLN